MRFKLPASVFDCSNLFPAYNDLIPSITYDGYSAFKRKYLSDIAKEAPPFLAYIESYDRKVKLAELGGDGHLQHSICTGSLVNTQYVLT